MCQQRRGLPDVAQAGSRTDYFVVSEPLVQFVQEVCTVSTPLISQHRPVKLVMRTRMAKPTIRALRRRYIPGPERLFGPPRAAPEAASLWESLRSALNAGSSHASVRTLGAPSSRLDRICEAWLKVMESEVAAHQDMTVLQLRAFAGRVGGPRFATINALTPVAYGYPRTSQVGREWRRLSARIRCLVQCIGAHIEDECRPVSARLRAIHHLQHKIAATAGVIRLEPQWPSIAHKVRGIRRLDAFDMVDLADEAAELAQRAETASVSDRSRGWRSWIRQALNRAERWRMPGQEGLRAGSPA